MEYRESAVIDDQEKKHWWSAQWIDVPKPWHAVLIPLPSIPVEKSLRAELHERLSRVMALLRGTNRLQVSTWLLMDTLHHDGESKKIAANGRRWIPDVGLGVWPDREPPRLWSDEELIDRDHETPVRPLMHTVIHISAGESGSMHAWETMLGTGSVIQLLLEKSPEEFHAAMKEVLLPTIEDETFRGFSMYFPLLSIQSIRDRNASELDRWMGSAVVYLRESTEDTGVLILSKIDPTAALKGAEIHIEAQQEQESEAQQAPRSIEPRPWPVEPQ